MSRTREQLEGWLKKLEVQADRVLDIGGSQLPVRGRLGHLVCNEYKILDLPDPHQEKQKADYIGDINFPLYIEDKNFDVIFCLEVMEYVFDPRMAIQNMSNYLNRGGTLYISFPFVYPLHNPPEQDYLRYTETGARKLLEMAGFQIISVFGRTAFPDNLEDFYRSEGMRMAKGYAYHDAVSFIFTCTKL